MHTVDMKRILLLLLSVFLALSACGQNYVRNGNEFSSSKSVRNSKEQKTGFTWKTSDGEVHDIFISEKGACYIKVKSKEGKTYKRYIPKEVASEIKKEINW